jgi:hypothetical protein
MAIRTKIALSIFLIWIQAEWSPSPLKLSSAGLRTTYLQGADVTLESTTNLSKWDLWEGSIEETPEDGYVNIQVPFESLTNQFFRLRY